MGKNKLSVIICTYNRCHLLRGVFDSLVNQSVDKELYEVIVIDNNSTDNTQEITEDYVKRYDNFRTVIEKNQGLSNARNRGYQEAYGDYVAYIDDDAKATPEWCEKIINAFLNVNPEPVAVGGEILPFYEQKPPAWFKDELEIKTYGKRTGFLEMPVGKCGFFGSNMTFKRDILEKYGGFSPEYGMSGENIGGCEETELFLRICKKDPYFWYDPEILVFHLVSPRAMSIYHRFCRTWKSGKHSFLLNKSINEVNYIHCMKKWIGLFLFLFTIPFKIITSKNKLVSFVKLIEELGRRTGYIYYSIMLFFKYRNKI